MVEGTGDGADAGGIPVGDGGMGHDGRRQQGRASVGVSCRAVLAEHAEDEVYLAAWDVVGESNRLTSPLTENICACLV